MFRFVVVIASIAAVAHGYSAGAPASVCQSLTPKHPAEPQATPSPYEIVLSNDNIKAGETVEVTLTGKDGETFKGYILEARVGEEIVGQFDIADNDRESKTIDCPNGKKNAATHRNKDEKAKVTLKWTAPQDLQDSVVFKATFVKDGLVFWVGQPSAILTVRQ